MFIRPFSTLRSTDAAIAGGKGASLGEMTQSGIPVPPGCVVVATAFEDFIDTNSLRAEITDILKSVNHDSVGSIESASERIQELILRGNISPDVQTEIKKYIDALEGDFFAIRSSATAEDGAEHAWAGQLDTYLNVSKSDIILKIQSCWASLFTPRALFYRTEKGLQDIHIGVAVVIQSMVDSESAGVAFSVHPVTENYDEIVIEGSYGLGEAVVSGEVTPDSFVVSKSSAQILSRHIAEKKKGLFRSSHGKNEWREIVADDQEKPIFSDQKIAELSELIIKIENHYGFPCDIEWAFADDQFFILQARPITTLKKIDESKNKFIDHIKEIDWSVQRFNAYPFFLDSAAALSGFRLGWCQSYKHFLAISCNRNIEWHYDKSDFAEIGKLFWDKVQSIDDLEKLVEEYRSTYNSVKQGAIYEEAALKTMSLFELKDLLHKQVDRLCASGGIAHIIECATFVGEQKLKDEYNLQPGSIVSREPSFLQKAEICAHELFESVKDDNKILEMFKAEYAWIQSSYLGRNEVTIDFIRELAEKNDSKKLSESDSANHNPFLEILSYLFAWQDERKANLLSSIYYSQPVLDALAVKLSISRESILFLLPEEIDKIEDPIFQKELIERSDIFVNYVPKNLQRTLLTSKDAQNFINDFSSVIDDKKHGVSGPTAFAGRVTGVARICLSLESISNFNHGEILVASMTRPEYISAMKKAAAFITDEGGITCHAAIIARELRKPCIIGTKNATKILKDGDLVEVDADAGVVKILPKNENKLSKLYQTQISLTEWFQNIGHKDTDILRTEDNEKRERLKVLGKTIGLPFDKPTKFTPRDIIEQSPEFMKYLAEHGHEKCALRLIPSEPGLPKFRMRGQTIADVVRDWFPNQDIDPDKYRAEFIPHPEINEWATIFVVNDRGIFGEIIADGHHHLTQGFYEDKKPIMFIYDFNTWTTFPKNRDAEKYLAEMTQCIYVKDSSKQDALKESLGAKFSHYYLKGYFETTHSEFGTWFIDYSPVIGDLYGDFSPSLSTHENTGVVSGISGYAGKVQGKVRIVFDPDGVTLQSDEILVCDMTSPDFVQLMQQARGIITDRGGLLSHAGIIARELKKPTILATSNATEILKDGDLVEVDADRGIVTVLKKKNTDLLSNKWEFSSERQSSIHMMYLFHVGYPELNALLGTHLTKTLYYTRDGNVSHYSDQDELRDARRAIAETLSDMQKVKNITQYIQQKFDTYQSEIASLPDIYNGDSVELWNMYQRHIEIESSISAATWIVFTTFLDEMTEVLIRGLSLYFGPEKVTNIIQTLSYPSQLTPLEIYYNNLSTYRDNPSDILKQAIIQKYRHMGMFDIFSSPKVWEDHLARMRDAQYTPIRKSIPIDVPDELAPLVELYQTYANLKEWKNFWREGLSYKYALLFQKIGSTLQKTPTEVAWMTFQEVEKALQGDKIESSIENRRKESICILDGDSLGIVTDKDMIEKFLENLDQEQSLKGYPLGGGKVKGRICIVISPDDYHKFEKGDILTTSTTRPDQIHLIQNCSAILTNEGGLLSHAAIIARELGKPCIIGTKNATKILKDGDFVEVDADRGVVTILEKHQNIFEKDWQITSTRNMPLWHNILCLFGWEDNVGEYGLECGSKCLFVVEHATHATMFVELESQQRYFLATAKLCKDGESVKRLREKYEKYAKQVQSSLEVLQAELTEKNLQKFFTDYQRFTTGLWITTAFGRIGNDSLQEALKKSGIPSSEIPENISLLTYPKERTPLFASQIDMVEIGEKIQNDPKLNITNELIIWLEKHKFIPVNYCEDPWSLEDAQEQLTSMLEQDCALFRKELLKNHEHKIQEREILREKYGKHIQDISDALAEATSLNEYRKNIFCRLSYDIRYVFAKVMQKVGSDNWRDAYYCTPEELTEIVEGQKLDIEKIKIEREKVVFVREGEKIIWGSSEQVKYFSGKIYQKIEGGEDNIVKGFSANRGKIIGTVKIVLSTKDFYKVQRGDILVATMTSVDFVPIMERSGAFVTNEGGITSHASIVAREMNKPCIIGTKNATRILHDGDLVEVDADNGVVKILRRAADITQYFEGKKFLSEGGRAGYLYPNRIFSSRTEAHHEIFWRNMNAQITVSHNHKVNWYTIVADESEFDYTLQRALRSPTELFAGEERIDFWSQKAQKYRSVDFRELSDSDLQKEYREYINIYEHMGTVAAFLRQIDHAVTNYLRKISLDEEEFAVAVYPSKRTYQRQEEVAILELARDVIQRKISEDEKKKALQMVYEKFFTSSLGYFTEEAKTYIYYESTLEAALMGDGENELSHVLQEEKEMSQRKSDLKKKVSSEADKVIDIAGFIVFLKDHYKFHINRVQYAGEGLFEAIAVKTDTAAGFLKDLMPEEIIQLLAGENIDRDKVHERIQNYIYLSDNLGNQQMLTGSDARNFEAKHLMIDDSKKEFSGRVACRGDKKTGPVRVILGTSDFHKMQQGDILVVMNTSPDFVPIMRKAAAIVAEEGGITGHVSVVSREFGIPSVVGIKQITSILHDGDLIQVDAENGIVTILK